MINIFNYCFLSGNSDIYFAPPYLVTITKYTRIDIISFLFFEWEFWFRSIFKIIIVELWINVLFCRCYRTTLSFGVLNLCFSGTWVDWLLINKNVISLSPLQFSIAVRFCIYRHGAVENPEISKFCVSKSIGLHTDHKRVKKSKRNVLLLRRQVLFNIFFFFFDIKVCKYVDMIKHGRIQM